MTTPPPQRQPQPTPEQLFCAYRRGDEAALGELVRQLGPWLTATARRAGARGSEIEEVVQDTWIAAAAAAEEFRAEASLLPWLATIVRHRLISLRREHRRRSRLHLLGGQRLTHAPAPDRSTDVAALERGREALLAVRKAVAMLPPEYHDVLHLHLFEDLTPVQIAQRLGLGRVTVRVRLFRGLRRLRRVLPDALALLLLLTLARTGRSQGPVVAAAAATTLAAATTMWFVLATGEPAAQQIAPTAAGPVAAATTSVVTAPAGAVLANAPERTVAAAALTVRVHDVAGAPLAGVGVTVHAVGGGDPLLLDRRACTAADGVATFAQVPAGALSVQSDRGVVATVAAAAGAREVELRCTSELSVRGRVVAADGVPVVGAAVVLAGPDAGPLAGEVVATTADDGSFTLRAVAAGSFLSVRAAGFAGLPAQPVRSPDAGTLVLAAAGGDVALRVDDAAGRPLADAVVVVGHRDTRTWIPQVDGELPTLAPPHRARSDANGHYLASGLAPGRHPLLVRSPGHAPFHTFVDVTAGGTTSVTARLQPGARLRGRLVDAEGGPVVAAHVACRCDDPFACVDADVAADGTFCFDAVPTGPVGLLVWSKGCNVAERVLTLAEGASSVEIVIALPQQRRGRIVTAAGAPLPGFELALPLPGPRSVEEPHRFATADASGHVLLDVVPEARWERLLLRPLGSLFWSEVGAGRQDLPDGSFVVRVAPEQLPSATLSARFTTADGLALADAVVHGVDDAGQIGPLGRTDADGRFGFGAVPAGTFRCFVEAPRPDVPGLDVVALAVEAGEARHYDVVAPAAGRVAFTLRHADGTAPRAPVVTIARELPGGRAARLHTAVGDQALAPGDYLLSAIGEDFVWRTDVAFTVRAGATTVLDLPVRAACERQFSLSQLAPEHRGGVLVGRFCEADTGRVLYHFRTPVDQAFPLPLVSYLPAGRIVVEATTAAGQRLRAQVELPDLAPSATVHVLPFELVR